MNHISKKTFVWRMLFCIAVSTITYLATTEQSYPVISDFNDKFSHVFAFLVLAFLADFSYPEYSYNYYKITALFGYGVLIEIIQYYIPNRQFSFYDMLADLIGLMLYMILLPYIKKIPIVKERWESDS